MMSLGLQSFTASVSDHEMRQAFPQFTRLQTDWSESEVWQSCSLFGSKSISLLSLLINHPLTVVLYQRIPFNSDSPRQRWTLRRSIN